MESLSILEMLVVFYWYLLDHWSYLQFLYWIDAGLQVKYAFKKVFGKL